MPASLIALAIAFVVTMVATSMQATIGFGAAIIAVPILEIIDPDLAPVPQMLIAFPMVATMVWRERDHIDFGGSGWLIAGRFPGLALGILLLRWFDDDGIALTMAAMVLVAVAMAAGGWQVRRTAAVMFGAGWASGTMGVVGSIGGPPLGLVYRNSSGPTVRATISAVFLVGIVMNVGGRFIADAIDMDDLKVAAVLLPAMAIGVWSSRFLIGRIEGAPLRVAILIVSAGAAIGLILKVAFG